MSKDARILELQQRVYRKQKEISDLTASNERYLTQSVELTLDNVALRKEANDLRLELLTK